MSAVTFIGDLHLAPGGKAGAEALRRLLESLPAGDALWVLGDLFEFWAGRGHEARDDYRAPLEAFRTAAGRGVLLHFIPGNRDFLFDGSAWGFRPAQGHESLLEAQGRRVYLAHGDFLCANDRAYLRAAAVLRSRPTLALARILPFAAVHALASAYRTHSERKRTRPPTDPLAYALTETLLAGKAHAHAATDLVVGHVHTPVDRPLEGAPATLHVLDPWHGDEAPFLRLEDGRWMRGTL